MKYTIFFVRPYSKGKYGSFEVIRILALLLGPWTILLN